MILSNKIDSVSTTQAGFVKDINEAVRDSGIRLGVQIWELILTNNQGSNVDPVLTVGDTLTVDINGVTVTAVFNTDVATTLQDFAVNITAQPFVTAEVEKDNKIKVTSQEGVENLLENTDVTGSDITQLTANERSEVTAVPAILVMNQNALEPLRTEKLVDTPVAGTNTTYAGYALPGANTANPVWRVQKITETATTTLIEYADGNENMDNVWDDRLSLSYS